MAQAFRYFVKGIELRGETADPSDNIEGSIFRNSTDNRLKTYIQSAIREIVTNSQSQTLTNKTIDADSNTISNLETDNLKAGVLNTSITLTGASDTQVPSALATKTYTDNSITNLKARETSFSIANNQSSAQDITGLLFNPSTFRGAKIEYTVYRVTSTAASAVAQIGEIKIVYNTQAGQWFLYDVYAGQNAGVEFSITATGQIQYTSSDIAGSSYVGTMKFDIVKTFGL